VGPWSGNLVWRKFLKSLEIPHEKVEGPQEEFVPNIAEMKESEADEAKEEDAEDGIWEEKEGVYIDNMGEVRKLEPLDNPVIWRDKKTNKKQCIFCSEERYALYFINF
jgi:hypothetical protein